MSKMRLGDKVIVADEGVEGIVFMTERNVMRVYSHKYYHVRVQFIDKYGPHDYAITKNLNQQI